MKSNDDIIRYLNNNFSTCEILGILRKNTLYFKFADKFVSEKVEEKKMRLTQLLSRVQIDAACKIFSDMEKMNIGYISFKGFVLSQLLYDSPIERVCGDFDFWVGPQYFEKAYSYLLQEGYKLLQENGRTNPHHIVLVNGTMVLELHRNLFHPMIGVNEEFLRINLQSCTVNDHNITTFNETASMLHLIYHFYMDTFLVSYDLYSVIMSREVLKADRFLYRSYEIALFSEKYSNKIDWKEIENDLKRQKLRIIFRRMISDIVGIFPNAFPDSFLETVFQLSYIENDNDNDNFYRFMIETGHVDGKHDFDCILCKYLNNTWLIHRQNNIHINIGDSFTINEKVSETVKDSKLCCEVSTAKTGDGIKLCFTVSDNDLYCSDNDNFDTLASDGVHLLLCGTTEYSYNSIFFFPKRNNGIIEVITVDVLNNVNKIMEKKYVHAGFSMTPNGYSISAVLTSRFIELNHLNSYFYMGLVVSDCSRQTMRRQWELILAKDNFQWYNPTYFARIEMNNILSMP